MYPAANASAEMPRSSESRAKAVGDMAVNQERSHSLSPADAAAVAPSTMRPETAASSFPGSA